MVMRGVPRGGRTALGITADAPVGTLTSAPTRAMIRMSAEARERAMGGVHFLPGLCRHDGGRP
eukprot:9615303-Alexandrium_andersonii.AAC.1